MLLYSGDDVPLSGPPTPVTVMEQLARTAVRVLPAVLTDLRGVRPDLIVHDSLCPWGPVAARELDVRAASSFTTFAFNRHVPSPTRGSWELLAAAAALPRPAGRYLKSRWELRRRYDTRAVPLIDLANIRQPLNLVYTSRALHPAADSFDQSYRFVGPSVGARPAHPSFPVDRLRDPVLWSQLRSPLWLITLGGFHNGANDITHAQHLDRLTSAGDRIERVGTWMFPQRWRLFRWSGWNRADRDGKITMHRLDPATHVGPRSYISPEARLPDGRSHLDRTADTVIALIRDRLSATAETDGPLP